MFFVSINILEVINLNEEKNWRNEIIAGSLSGVIVGIAVAIVAFLLLNIWIWFLLSSAFLTTIAVWIGYGMLLTLFYKILYNTIYKNIAFLTVAIITIGLMNNAYNMLAYDMLPYSSLSTIRVMALVSMGIAIGFIIKIIVEPKKEEAKTTTQ